jgi:hypothetical protein
MITESAVVDSFSAGSEVLVAASGEEAEDGGTSGASAAFLDSTAGTGEGKHVVVNDGVCSSKEELDCGGGVGGLGHSARAATDARSSGSIHLLWLHSCRCKATWYKTKKRAGYTQYINI